MKNTKMKKNISYSRSRNDLNNWISVYTLNLRWIVLLKPRLFCLKFPGYWIKMYQFTFIQYLLNISAKKEYAVTLHMYFAEFIIS